MPDKEQPPAGYCPFCDYPINAGLCPECGEFIPQEKLRTSMRKHRIRRAIFRGFKYTFILALIGGLGYGVYHEIQPDRWVRYVSTDYLLDLEELDAGVHIKSELDRRYVEGLLKDEQINQIIRLRYIPEPIALRSPWPVGLIPRLVGHLPCSPDDHGAVETDFHGWSSIDEDEIWLGKNFIASIQYQPIIESDFFTKIRSLPAGEYSFERRQTISAHRFPFSTNKSKWPTNASLLTYFRRSLEIKTNIELTLVNKRPEEMVTGSFSEEHRKALLGIEIFEDSIGKGRGAMTDPIHVFQLAGYLNIKSNKPMAGLNSTVEFQIPQESCYMRRTIAAYGPDMQNVDITFTPDATTALNADYGEYFNGIIRWKNVNLFEGLGLPNSIEPMIEE